MSPGALRCDSSKAPAVKLGGVGSTKSAVTVLAPKWNTYDLYIHSSTYTLNLCFMSLHACISLRICMHVYVYLMNIYYQCVNVFICVYVYMYLYHVYM